jgi:hypothetical protein
MGMDSRGKWVHQQLTLGDGTPKEDKDPAVRSWDVGWLHASSTLLLLRCVSVCLSGCSCQQAQGHLHCNCSAPGPCPHGHICAEGPDCIQGCSEQVPPLLAGVTAINRPQGGPEPTAGLGERQHARLHSQQDAEQNVIQVCVRKSTGLPPSDNY